MLAPGPATERQRLLPPALLWSAIRPKTLSLAAVPVLAGSALAWRDGAAPAWGVFVLTLVAGLLIQAATNLLNDAADGERGNDGPERLGPGRLTGPGLATATQVRNSAWLLFTLAGIAGVLLITVGGWPILAIGVASLIAGWAYSSGPRPLSHSAWGEVFVLAFFGLAAVGGSYWLQAGTMTTEAAFIGLALGLQAAAVLLMNNIRDRDADALAGRRTLAQLLGQRRALGLYAALLLAPFPLLALGLGKLGFVWLALPLCALLAWQSRTLVPGPLMNRHMVLTVAVQVLVGVLLVIQLLPETSLPLRLWTDAA